MLIPEEDYRYFENEYLKDLYLKYITLSSATGIDNMSHKLLWPILEQQLLIINKKVSTGTYVFSKYKLKLISKGRGKSPREISIPTLRDKIALRALCDLLQKKYSGFLENNQPQVIVKKIKNDIFLGPYDVFLKFDVSNFYPSINHEILMDKLKHKIVNESILKFIFSALTSPTVSRSSKQDKKNNVGVPQGLSISNVLAAIYLSEIDVFFKERDDLSYYRYVDDVLILCKNEESNDISSLVIEKFKSLDLIIYDPLTHPEKSAKGTLSDGYLSYLGYSFQGGVISPRSGSIERLRESLMAIFTGYKHSNLKSVSFLEWRVNLRITGCIFEGKSKGWMFFFSEINNENLLHEIDFFVKKACVRFGVKIKLKSLVRTHFEIKYNRFETKYIPNFDTYVEADKVYILNNYFNKSTENLTSLEIDYHFRKRISRQVKDIETDIQDAGY